MKSYQMLKIYKHFDKARKKHTAVNEKLRKSGLCFITGCFIKPFKIQLFFLFWKLIRCAIFAFYYQDDAKNTKRGNWERQIAKNGKLQYLFQK